MSSKVYGMNAEEIKNFMIEWHAICINIRKDTKVSFLKNRKSSQGVNYSYKW